MRTLHLPQVSAGEVAAESNVIVHRSLARTLQRVRPGHAYLMLRDIDEGKIADATSMTPFFEEDGRVRSFYVQHGYADLHRLVDLFGWHLGSYPTDVVFTSRTGLAPVLAIAMGAHPTHRMPVVLHEPRVVGVTDEARHNLDSPEHLALRSAAYAVCIGLYMSESYRQEAYAAARYHVAPALVDRWFERSFLLPNPVEVPEPDPSWQRDPRRKRLLFAGRLNSNKRWQELLKVFESVYMARDDVEVWLHSPTGAYARLDPSQHRWHRTTEKLTRRAYAELMYTTHVGAYMSRDEGPNAVVQELLLAGVVMALPDRPWVRKLFEPLEYPYLASGPETMKTMLDWLLDNEEEARGRLQPIRDLIQREHTWATTEKHVVKLLEYLDRWPRPEPYRAFGKIAKELDQGHGVPFSTVRKAMHKDGRSEAQAIQSAYACYRAVSGQDDLSMGMPQLRFG